jgi:hypothetical protein
MVVSSNCKLVDLYNLSCCYKTQSTGLPYDNAPIDNWTEVPSSTGSPPTCKLLHKYSSVFDFTNPQFVGPSGNGQTWKTGGKTYMLCCGNIVGSTAIIPADPQPDAATCATTCASVAGCKSVDWSNKSCCYKTQATEPVYDYAAIDNWLEVPEVDTPPPPLACKFSPIFRSIEKWS